jgi:hypothetical protein
MAYQVRPARRHRSAAALGIVAAASILALLPLSCSTTSGSTYSSGVDDSRSAAARSKAASDEKKKDETTPAKPRPPSNPYPPSHDTDPWHDEPSSDTVDLTLFFNLASQLAAPAAGTLVLSGIDWGAQLYVDGGFHGSTSVALPPGPHQVLVKRFGYRDFQTTATVYPGSSTLVSVELEPAPFAIEALAANPASFDPADPGAYGSCSIGVRVASPGRFRLEVLDARGRVARDLGERQQSQAYAAYAWDGRDDGGRDLSAGLFTIRASSPGTGAAATAAVEIAPGSYARHSSLFSGVSGALFAPDARVLEPGRVETSLGTAMINVSPRSDLPSRILAFGGLRASLSASEPGLELDLSGMFDFYPELWNGAAPPDSGGGAIALKYRMLEGPLSAAVYTKLSLNGFLQSGDWPTDWDGSTRYAGISTGLPLEAALGGLRAFLTPELVASTFYPGYGDGRWEVPGLFTWGYLRFGLEYTMVDVSVAASCALRSQPFNAAFGLRLPVSAGMEFRWHSPDTPFVLALDLSGEFEGRNDYYLMGGLCLGRKF